MATLALTFNSDAQLLPKFWDYKLGESSAAEMVKSNYKIAWTHYVAPISTQRRTLYRFYGLYDSWKYGTYTKSSPTEIATHPAYQEIIGMGKPVLPLIFRELALQNDYWYWALKAITGEDPVSPQDRGDLSKMRLAWLDWGNKYGYV